MHRKDLMRIDDAWQKEWNLEFENGIQIFGIDGSCITPSCDKMAPHAFKMLDLLKERIPTHRSKVIVDLPVNFRDNYGKFLLI